MHHQNRTAFPEDTALAIAYVKWQNFGNVYEAEEGFVHGTIFPDLDKPFYGRRARYGMQTRR